MKTALLIIFSIISVIICLAFFICSLYFYINGKRNKRVLSSIQIFTIGVFLSVLLIFIPIYYIGYDFGDPYDYIRPLFLAIHTSLRIFILDGDFEIIINSIRDQTVVLRVLISFYSAFLYVVAPVLTFSNVLSLLKNIKGEFRYKWHRLKKHYIMSELNEKSIVLAKSIHKKNKNTVIVFTDVFEQNSENNYELLTQARDINAICLKKDISHLDFISKKGDIEIFLIGDDESENVSQAIKITDELNRKNIKHNIKLFVFSSKPCSSYIVDSIKYDNLLQYASENEYGESCFKLRRINEKQQLIWNTIPNMKLYDIAERYNNTLSVMIVGFGSYGIEFFKTLVWYCQFEGYKLQINIIDKQGEFGEEKNYIKSIINRMSPELLKKNRSETAGESYYDIEIYSGVDVKTYDFDELLLYDGDEIEKSDIAKRLQLTNLAFVSLGDDDTNIDVAIHLRSLFDRINGVAAQKNIKWEDEAVEIYSVVYDDQKSRMLFDDSDIVGNSRLLFNHKDVPYHIHFIGGMSSQFDYCNIYDSDLEKNAYEHHVGWVKIEEKIYNEWKKANDQVNLQKHEWYFQGEKSEEAAQNARKKYEKYEYYRLSSIAKELYQREINNNPNLKSLTSCSKDENRQICDCDNCLRRKRSEHMRWNAYTRVLGYTYHPNTRADRALLHDNLCEWSQLSELDRQKD